MLADAGLDFLFTDCTNDSIHPKALTTLLDTAKALQDQGVRLPKVLFFLNTEYESKVEQPFTKFYANPAYATLWFRWQGKPLLLFAASDGPRAAQGPSLCCQHMPSHTALLGPCSTPRKIRESGGSWTTVPCVPLSEWMAKWKRLLSPNP